MASLTVPTPALDDPPTPCVICITSVCHTQDRLPCPKHAVMAHLFKHCVVNRTARKEDSFFSLIAVSSPWCVLLIVSCQLRERMPVFSLCPLALGLLLACEFEQSIKNRM